MFECLVPSLVDHLEDKRKCGLVRESVSLGMGEGLSFEALKSTAGSPPNPFLLPVDQDVSA